VSLSPELIERFLSKIELSPTGCWIWTGWLKHNGYGMFDVPIAGGGRVKQQAHRISYELFVGPLIEGLTIDHVKEMCSSRACVNPFHLRQITRGDNVRAGDTLAARNLAKTHCVNGHEFTPENTYHPPKRPRSRYCNICRKAASERRQEKLRAMSIQRGEKDG